MKQKRLVKIVFMLVFVISAFHLSGIESAFCEDGTASGNVESHGCMVCQAGNHSIIIDSMASIFTELKEPFFSFQSLTLRVNSPARSIFHPPLFA